MCGRINFGRREMDNKYINISKKLKVLSDPKRLEIVDMLSCEELCACEILDKFDISQPTLSSDMKKLEDANIIKSRKEGKNVFYIVNKESLDELYNLLGKIFESSLDCICKK